jgi:DNA-binding Lrp family transcriptional regulator
MWPGVCQQSGWRPKGRQFIFGGWGGEIITGWVVGGGLMELDVHNVRRRSLDAFQAWAVKAPEVQACWHAAGDMDDVLQVAVRDLDEYNDFIDRMMREQQGLVRKYKGLIALKVMK